MNTKILIFQNKTIFLNTENYHMKCTVHISDLEVCYKIFENIIA